MWLQLHVEVFTSLFHFLVHVLNCNCYYRPQCGLWPYQQYWAKFNWDLVTLSVHNITSCRWWRIQVNMWKTISFELWRKIWRYARSSQLYTQLKSIVKLKHLYLLPSSAVWMYIKQHNCVMHTFISFSAIQTYEISYMYIHLYS